MGSLLFYFPDSECLLRGDANVVPACRERSPSPRSLWQPPHFPYPFVLARHHLFTQKIHQEGTCLRRRIECVRMRKWPQHRIRFRTCSA